MALTDGEVVALFEELIRNDHGAESGISLSIENLVALRNVDTSRALELQPTKNWPSWFYHTASSETRDRLIELLWHKDGRANNLLLNLAFVGDSTVVDRFHDWQQSPPDWQATLPGKPSIYAEEAGWLLTNDGARHELTFAGTVATERLDGVHAAVLIGGRLDQKCPRCEVNLVNALTFDGADPQFAFLGIEGKVQIPMCDWCVLDNHLVLDVESELSIWVHYQLDGTSRMEITGPTEFDSKGWVETMDVMWTSDVRAASPWRAFAESVQVPVIGGNPMWLQDAQYARCPECNRAMRHLAWIPLTCLVSDGADGIWYLQACVGCQIATTVYQQT